MNPDKAEELMSDESMLDFVNQTVPRLAVTYCTSCSHSIKGNVLCSSRFVVSVPLSQYQECISIYFVSTRFAVSLPLSQYQNCIL